jgi:RimJ/RimL family protein N-acetyltransferase
MKPPEQIETERLILRKPRMDDAPAVFSGWVQDPEVTRFLTWRPHENIGQTESMLAKAITEWDGDARFHFMITLKNGDLIGRIQLHIESHRVELGYVMNKSFQGRGYMTETVRSIIDWAFQQPNIYSIFPIIWGGLKIKKRVNFETC